MFISYQMESIINRTILTLAEIHEKIVDDSLAEFICFPQSPDLTLCLDYSTKLRTVAFNLFPKIPKKIPYPDIYALAFTLLLYSSNIDLYNKCESMNDIWHQLNDPSISYVVTDDVEYRDEDAKLTCICSHDIETVFMCSANNNFFILGSVCINKSEIISLKEQLKELSKVICEICEVKRRPANINIAICVPCSKKIKCKFCRHFKKPSKKNSELCTPCYKDVFPCRGRPSCMNYHYTWKSYCDECILLKHSEQDERNRLLKQEQDERNRLLKLKQDESERNRLDQLEQIKERLRLQQEEHIRNTQQCLGCTERIPISKFYTKCRPCYLNTLEKTMKCLDCPVLLAQHKHIVRCVNCFKKHK